MLNDKSSQWILQVERAVGDLRRGQAVIVSDDGKEMLVTAGEYAPDETSVQDHDHPGVKLMKIAGLLPQAIVTAAPANTDDFLKVTGDAITNYPKALASTVKRVSEAPVPLQEAQNAKIIAFRSRFGHDEHLAVVIGNPNKEAAPLVRLHSSCVTGDVFHSLKCDCGNQLQKAIATMHTHGSGIVLYLNQEGRGIGIANKLRAYALQDKGVDTLDANLQIGFLADERDFAVAAEMLKQLDISRVILLTNNPEKIKALAEHGIEVVRREPLLTERNIYNDKYLDTKALKFGHQLKD